MKRKSLITLISMSIIFGTAIVSYAYNNPKSGLQLKLTPKPAENMVRLDWSGDTREKTFKVYQKKPGSTSFQTIGATDFDKSKQVKVLNVHPNAGPNISFTTWDGETLNVAKSASLKKWMEEPNPENPKGYGKGIVEVTPVSLANFNTNPNAYLKDGNGNWKYDSIMFGTYDCNGYCSIDGDISEIGATVTREFIQAGRGVLMGHDTAYWSVVHNNFNNLLDLFNMQIGHGIHDPIVPPANRDDKVVIRKKGLLTNYPWVIGDIDTVLKVPTTHTTGQLTKGDIWMDFLGSSPVYNGYKSNFYLTTWNNTGYVLTGHSNAEATPDEQKLLANALFYLNQLSTDTFLEDRSGQDLSAPNKPIIEEHSMAKGKVSFKLTKGKDNGSDYHYYVEAEGKDGGKITSNTATTTVTTGFKGYSYVIDNKTDTTPDNSVDIGDEVISGNIQGNTTYLHVKAIDNVGNASETLHYKIEDKEKPVLNVIGNLNEWTNDDILLNVDATDSLSGLKEIILPDGSKTSNSTAVFRATQNSTLKFEAIDYAGNKETVNINVNKIDKTNPILNATKEINPNKREGFININISDSNSGIKELILPNGSVISNATTYKYPITANGNYLFTGVDNTNNKTIITVNVSELEIGNSSGIDRIEYKLHGATTKGWTVYNEPFYITNEGITYITARSYDRAGNISSEATSEAKLDKTKPINNSIKIELIK